jgi:hypothetical protein
LLPELRLVCMSRTGRALVLVGTSLVSIALIARQLPAQTPDELRRAFVDLHDDNVPHNCEHATEWLFKYREQLKNELVEELYKTDWQGRDAILYVLYNTATFSPDDRFIDFVTASLTERDTHDPEWKFINDHFAQFEPRLKELLGKTRGRPHGMNVLWCITWLVKKHDLLEQYSPLYTREVMETAAMNLKNDDQHYNASQAVRFFLILGDKGLPILRETAHSSDTQAASLARAVLDGLGGSRDAFGFLSSKTLLEATPFGPRVETPAWHAALVEKYMGRENYP